MPANASSDKCFVMANDFSLVFFYQSATAKLKVIVEQEITRRFALLDGKGRERCAFFMNLNHSLKVDVADDIDVVKDEWLVFGCACAGMTAEIADFAKKPCGFFQAAAGIEQNIFAGKFNVHAEIAGGFYMVHHHVSIVMDVDDDVVNTEVAQARERDFQQRFVRRLQPEL